MKFKMIHENYNVSDLDRSIKFYNEDWKDLFCRSFCMEPLRSRTD